MSRAVQNLTINSLKDLGLYSAFDVSKWCAKNGIQSIYLEHQKEKIMQVAWSYLDEPCWVVKDATQPGKVIKKFYIDGDSNINTVRSRAEAWVFAAYETPMKYLRSMKSAFPAPAVDILLDELDTMIKIWSDDAEIRATVPILEKQKFLLLHPNPPHHVRNREEVKSWL